MKNKQEWGVEAELKKQILWKCNSIQKHYKSQKGNSIIAVVIDI